MHTLNDRLLQTIRTGLSAFNLDPSLATITERLGTEILTVGKIEIREIGASYDVILTDPLDYEQNETFMASINKDYPLTVASIVLEYYREHALKNALTET